MQPPTTATQSSKHLSSGVFSRVAAKSRPDTTVNGIIRKHKRTKTLVKRLRPGDIALIDHTDLDAVAAQALVECRPSAVINASAPISGRYPNRGPSILAAARIPLFELTSPELYDFLADGSMTTLLPDNSLHQSGVAVPDAIHLWDERRIDEAVVAARKNMTGEIRRFAHNTLEYVQTEAESLLEPMLLPDLTGVPKIEKSHVVIVVRGEGYREDLASIRGYLMDLRPVIIGVDGGADALLEAGVKPHMIIGDMDSVSDRALRCGAKLIVHAYAASGHAPGLDRVRELGLHAEIFPVPGTSEDAAMLLAYERGAELIVAVGTHSNLEDFLDKGRAGMASTFLTRLKVGSRLVDARGVSKLHAPRLGLVELSALVLAATFVVLTILTQSPVGLLLVGTLKLWWRLTLVHLRHHLA